VTVGRACRAALVAALLLALPPAAGAADASPTSRAKAKAKHAAARKHKRTRAAHQAAIQRIRWRPSSEGLRLGAGFLFGATTPGAPSLPGGTPGTGTQPGVPEPPAIHHAMSVASREFSLTLSRAVLTPGLETIQLNNRGEDPHNLVVSPEDSHQPLAELPETGPDATHTQQVDLPAGRYRLWCSLPGHEEAGMKATLRVE
jgi:plastocyanin